MKLLHRYLLKHFLRILALSLSAFVGIYLLIEFFEKISDFLDHQARAADYASYLLNSLAPVAIQILPLAVLMTVVLTLGGLGRSNEITAMRSCGVSLWRIIQPCLAVVLVLSFGVLLLNEFVVPHNHRILYQLLEVKLKGRTPAALTRDEIWFRHGNRIINVRLAEPRQKLLLGVSVFLTDANGHLMERLEADQVRFDAGEWRTARLRIRTFSADGSDLETTRQLNQQTIDLGRTPADFASQEQRNNELNFLQLRRLVGKLERGGFDATRQRVDMHSRLATPFTCLVMGFLGVPFALQRGRRSNLALGVGISLGIGVIYFLLQALVRAFGYSGALPPLIAAWAGNLIFLMLGVWMLLSLKE